MINQNQQLEVETNWWRQFIKQKIHRTPDLTNYEDSEFVDAVKPHMLPGETSRQFISRTGLGPFQAKRMSGVEIAAFIRTATENARDDYANALEAGLTRNGRNVIPKKILLDD